MSEKVSQESFALTALSPLDGRYRSQLLATAEIFSEYALIKQRVTIEVAYVLFLSRQRLIAILTKKQISQIQQIAGTFDVTEAEKIKEIEKRTKHDVKAVEYYLTEKLLQLKSPVASDIHLGLTSEDVNSIAYSMMVQAAQKKLLVPSLKAVLHQLAVLAEKYADTPILARTHGQPAVPTTMGKEMLNFAIRLWTELQILEDLPIEAKVTGAVGNFNAHRILFPQTDWVKLSQEFIVSLGLKPQLFTTQILPVESYSRFFSSLILCHGILLDVSQDIWRYISDGYFRQLKSDGQVGSSTMPHKVNPIDFENCEGNLGLANALLQHFILKLPVSRLQRDLSDSTVKRSIGSAIGYSILAQTSLLKGLQKITVDEEKVAIELNNHWEILSEAYQTILRENGDVEGYQKLQKFTQGQKITQQDCATWIESLTVPEKIKKQLRSLSPGTYLGYAPELTHQGLALITRYLKGGS